jgi:hypothetical protein
MKALIVTIATVLVACGGVATSDVTTEPDAATDGPRADVDLAGPHPCGAKTCGAGEYCIHPCCGGAPRSCSPVLDGSSCPIGTHYESTCGNLNGPGCLNDPCTPPPPYCASKPTCGQAVEVTPPGRDVSCKCG